MVILTVIIECPFNTEGTHNLILGKEVMCGVQSNI